MYLVVLGQVRILVKLKKINQIISQNTKIKKDGS